ncbi:unnamed protein product [Thlaspi arvense]|uniref:Plant thionin family protein n=1 Tax=Thlaspi arvense TaxID=13288 RepID=A0AAU9R6E0_THLAR|nr:unnamed protein product [Thlaspi arvense]
MDAKWNSMIVIMFVVAMVMAMNTVNAMTLSECRDNCPQSCAFTGAPEYKCLQSCYQRCQGLPPYRIVEAHT